MRGEKGERELLEKRWGRVRLYAWRRAKLADEAGSDAMPDDKAVTRPLN